MTPFEIQRELLTLEEKVIEIRAAFLGYNGSDEDTPEMDNLAYLAKKIRTLQAQMRRFFAP